VRNERLVDMNRLRAEDQPWPDFHRRLNAGTPLILTVGSFEQHGPHLPLSTDAFIVDKLATAVADQIDALVLPTLPFGAPSRPRSGGGDVFPVPDLPLPILISAVGALAGGALLAGCRWLIVMSWHMENAAFLWDALREPARAASVAKIQMFHSPWDFLTPELEAELFPDVEPSWEDDHAGRLETAMMLHLAPDMVGDPPAPVPFVRRRGYDVLPTPQDAVPSTGVILDSRNVTAATGERSTTAIVDGLVASIQAERARG
jgi:creatinine amidohydrolase